MTKLAITSKMEALKAEARKIEAEIEAFSCRTAKEVADLMTAISDIEDESDNMVKREKNIDIEKPWPVKRKQSSRH